MNIALMTSWNPRTLKSGPRVPVDAGKWRVILKGVVGTLLNLRYNFPPHPTAITTFSVHDGYEFKLEQNVILSVLIIEAGNEPHISVNLQKIG